MTHFMIPPLAQTHSCGHPITSSVNLEDMAQLNTSVTNPSRCTELHHMLGGANFSIITYISELGMTFPVKASSKNIEP